MKLVRPLLPLALLASLLGGACRKESRVDIDLPRLASEVDKRAALAVERPEVDAELDKLFTAIAADPAVASAAERLVSVLGADAELASAFGDVVAQIGEDPGLQRIVLQMMAENPGLSPERIGALMEQRVGAVVDGKDFDAAFENAFAKLLAHPRIDGPLQRFGEAVASNDAVTKALKEIVDGRALERKFTDRLVKLNGGNTPDRGKATQLLLDHAFTVERLARFYKTLFSMPLLKRELATGAGKLLGSDAFHKLVKKNLRPMLADRELRGRLVKLVLIMVEEKPGRERIEAAVADLLALPVVADQIGAFLDELVTSPDFKDLGGATLTRITGDPAFRQMVATTLFEGW